MVDFPPLFLYWANKFPRCLIRAGFTPWRIPGSIPTAMDLPAQKYTGWWFQPAPLKNDGVS